MKKLILLASLIPAMAVSASAKKDLDELSSIVDRSAQNLGGLIECDRLDARDKYIAVLKDALSMYPGVSLTKMRALVRQIEEQGESIGKMGIKGVSVRPTHLPDTTAEGHGVHLI